MTGFAVFMVQAFIGTRGAVLLARLFVRVHPCEGGRIRCLDEDTVSWRWAVITSAAPNDTDRCQDKTKETQGSKADPGMPKNTHVNAYQAMCEPDLKDARLLDR